MKITTKQTDRTFEIIIQSENTIVSEGIATNSSKPSVPQELYEQLITAAFEMSRFSGISDVETVKEIYDLFLNEGEKLTFQNLLHP